MATLADVIRKRRSSGQSRTGSLMGSLKEKFKEKIDPRQFLNQSGILTALFPSLKTFKATGSKDTGDSGILSKSVALIGSSMSLSQGQLEKISINTQLIAKNSISLPGMSRDMNVMRQNIIKITKSLGVPSTNKADSFFKRSSEREAEYESKVKEEVKKSEDGTKEAKPKSDSVISRILSLFGKIISPIISLFQKLLTTVLGTFKFLMGTLVAPLMTMITKNLDKFSLMFTNIISKVMKKILSITTLLRSSSFLTSLFSKFFLTGPGALLLVLLIGGVLAEKEKRLHEYYLDLEKRREELLSKPNLMPDERIELTTIEQVLKNANTGYRVVKGYGERGTAANPLGKAKDTILAPNLVEDYLDGLQSSDPEEQKKTKETLKSMYDLGEDQEQTLLLYQAYRYGPNATRETAGKVKTLRDAQRMVQSSSAESDMFMGNVTDVKGKKVVPDFPLTKSMNQGTELGQKFRDVVMNRNPPENPSSKVFKNQVNNEKTQTENSLLATTYDENFTQYYIKSMIGQ